jgi:hypothetical protein
MLTSRDAVCRAVGAATPISPGDSRGPRAREEDPRLARRIRAALGDAASVLDVGAGAGSYEPRDLDVVAVDPEPRLLELRSAHRRGLGGPGVQGRAEDLPFRSDSFDAVMALATIHYWGELDRGLGELIRVARRRVVIFTWDPAFEQRSWITRDYFPIVPGAASPPPLDHVRSALGGRVEVRRILMPHDCRDGMLHAYWRRPEAYLDAELRARIGWFRERDPQRLRAELASLQNDLESGQWKRRNHRLLGRAHHDVGYRLVIAEVGARSARARQRRLRASAPSSEIFDRAERLPPDWDELVLARRASVFYSRVYLTAYERSGPGEIEAFRYLLLRDRKGNAVGAAPAYRFSSPDPRGIGAGTTLEGPSAARGALLTPCWHCYDGSLPVSDSEATLGALWRDLAAAAGALDCGVFGVLNLPAAAPGAATLSRLGAELHVRDARYRLIRAGQPFTDLATAASSARRNFARHVRRGLEAGVTVEAEIGRPELIATVAMFSHLNALRHGQGLLYPADRLRAFATLLGDRCLTVLIRLCGEPIGGSFCLLEDQRFHTWIGGVVAGKLGTFSPNYLLLYAELLEADKRGARVFEGGRRSGEFKERHGMQRLDLAFALGRL